MPVEPAVFKINALPVGLQSFRVLTFVDRGRDLQGDGEGVSNPQDIIQLWKIETCLFYSIDISEFRD
jgi:hypothetical protein